MPTLVRQEGFCLICGNSVHSNDEFVDSERGCVHEKCLEKQSAKL
ncbi:MAG: hypothetical protein ABEJ36_05125 [Candidatus Nanosalina sp.]